MKKIFFISFLCMGMFLFAQESKEIKLLDDVLLEHVGKTTKDYIQFIEGIEKDYLKSKTTVVEIKKKNKGKGLVCPSSPIFSSEEYPLTFIDSKKYGKVELKSFLEGGSNLKFSKVLKVNYLNPEERSATIDASKYQYGVYFIDVE